MDYSPTLWKRGDIITAEKLNKVETGLQAAASVDIQSAQATTLAAGAPATAVIEGGVLKLGIPRGQTGAQGAPPVLRVPRATLVHRALRVKRALRLRLPLRPLLTPPSARPRSR